MVYKNVEIHNAAELIDLGDGVTWKRFPEVVCQSLELDKSNSMVSDATGVEIRFIIKGDEARIRMASLDTDGMLCTFHVYYGSIQGAWSDHEINKCIGSEPTEFVFKRPPKLDSLKKISEECGYTYDPEVIRVIFDRGHIKIMDVIGDVIPPSKEQLPKSTVINYGSSITHGSNSIDMSHSWTYIVAHRLGFDCRNLGMAGSCAMEPAVVDYISSEGQKGNWDIATLELGINVLKWEEDSIRERVYYTVHEIAVKNPSKPIIVISPFYSNDDFVGKGNADRWRKIIPEIIQECNFKNVHYKSGLDFIDSMEYISADLVHPNIYGVQRISDRLTDYIEAKNLLT